jgi:hypothetical protein
MILAQLAGLKLNLPVTALQGTCNGLEQFNRDICLTGTVNFAGIPSATAVFGTATPTILLVVAAVEAV